MTKLCFLDKCVHPLFGCSLRPWSGRRLRWQGVRGVLGDDGNQPSSYIADPITHIHVHLIINLLHKTKRNVTNKK
jgi:hypothetical protein